MRAVVDRVDVLEPRHRAIGRWNLPESLDIFVSHFPRFPVVPGSLILQALVELAAVVVQEADGPTWNLKAIHEVRFRRYVRPGDELELSVEVVDDAERDVAFGARALVDGTLIMTIRRLELSASREGDIERS